jgi:hypothetical protein
LQARTIVLHCRVRGEPGPHFAKDPRCVIVMRLADAIVNPLAVAPRRNYSGAFQVSEMAGNLWLVDLQNLDQKANANFIFTDKIYQSQTRSIGKRFE